MRALWHPDTLAEGPQTLQAKQQKFTLPLDVSRLDYIHLDITWQNYIYCLPFCLEGPPRIR